MNGSTENTAHGASEKPGRRETLFNLATAQRMLPLVRRIVADLLHQQQCLVQLLPEQDRLDRQRRTLSWPDRARRYQVQEEIAAANQHLQEALVELANLGVALVNAQDGRVGFPTVVNRRPAYFSWRAGEEELRYWHYPDESARRPIPANWVKSAHISLSPKS
jgi:hypothetical protein